ncbi:MAG: HAD hydrolase-like protein [Candidatus Woesebacteria bacterium]|nr:HAD hydrolase-like protein [Candidatus Woesebacteria bacterium]
MKETKEKTNPTQIAFFDADKTLWQVVSQSKGDDYASKGAFDGISRTFILDQENVVIRLEDETKLILKDGVIETLEKLTKEGVAIGIISDNVYEDVQKVSELLKIWQYFDKAFTNVILWNGPADKALMIFEILNNQPKIEKSKVLLVDDGERYGTQMAQSGHNFILSPKATFPKALILEFFGIK